MKNNKRYIDFLDEVWIPMNYNIKKQIESKENVKKELLKYKEEIEDIKYAIKNSLEGLIEIKINEIDKYKLDEYEFLIKMIEKLSKKIYKSYYDLKGRM